MLPYLGHRDLFDQYDFSQPWDSAKNLRLLDKMPAVFHDPIYGEELGHFTHYAAVVGTNGVLTAFSGPGVEMKNATIGPLERLSEQNVVKHNGELTIAPMGRPPILGIAQTYAPFFSARGPNGTSGTIVVAAVSPERKILWTKPEDVTVGPKFPLQLGKPDGIAAPYSFGKTPTIHRAAPVLLANGLSIALLDTIEPSSLYALLTPESSNSIDWNMIPEARFATYSSPLSTTLLVDCATGRATITEPTLIEAGAPRQIQPTPRPVRNPEAEKANVLWRPDRAIQPTPRPVTKPEVGRPKAPLVIELPYPYELGWTYEVTKVDPGGTAQIAAIGPSPESEWDEAEPGAAWGGRGPGKAVLREPWVFGGPCLMLVKPLVDGGEPGLFRAEVNVVGVTEWTVELGKAGAAKIRPGDRCSLVGLASTAEDQIRWLSAKKYGFRRPSTLTEEQLRFLLLEARNPSGNGMSYPLTTTVTPDQLRAFPQVIPIVPARKEEPKARESLQQARTLANLSAIGRAIKRFSDRHRFWPPAFLVGQDGKRWHSWRVLLLPHLGHRDLFDEYDFSQPWDRRKNLRLLDKMPAVFHDPIYGDDLGHFTHYAALVRDGPGPKFAGAIPPRLRFEAFSKGGTPKGGTPRFETVFSPAGLSMKGATIWPVQRLTQGDVIKGADGEFSVDSPLILSGRIQGSGGYSPVECLTVAAVSPERKIPWTKPEDIAVGPEFPLQLGKPGGIAAPYSSGKAPHLHRARARAVRGRQEQCHRRHDRSGDLLGPPLPGRRRASRQIVAGPCARTSPSTARLRSPNS